ncbi:MAG: helix-turn-helix domain-containing protein [Alphaproteobacteria bacterium]|nr:helix-turn-helix domain-containing protein [Alphaproteobacteria bacterium]MCL2505856.1 helix-turn-helix domain-containing protein [Alphaproteobacteria bacterium]
MAVVSGRQIRAARALVGISQQELAEAVGLTKQSISKIEDGAVTPRAGTISDIVKKFHKFKVEFTPNEGLCIKSDSVTKLSGKKDFMYFVDLEYEAALAPSTIDGTKPFCMYNLDSRMFKKYLQEYHDAHVERLKKIKDLKIRIISPYTKEEQGVSNNYLDFRYIKDPNFAGMPFCAFGDYFAVINFDVEDPPEILLVYSQMLADSYRKQFDLMWKYALPSLDDK